MFIANCVVCVICVIL